MVVDLRSNGVIVFVPAYGIKAAVRCCSASGASLLAAGMLDERMRTDAAAAEELVEGGPVTIDSTSVTLSSTDGRQFVFRRFDHVLVRLGVVQSRYRFNEIALVLLGPWPAAKFSGAARVDIARDTTKPGRIEAQVLDSISAEQQLLASYGQTRGKHSLYELVQRFTDLALIAGDT